MSLIPNQLVVQSREERAIIESCRSECHTADCASFREVHEFDWSGGVSRGCKFYPAAMLVKLSGTRRPKVERTNPVCQGKALEMADKGPSNPLATERGM